MNQQNALKKLGTLAVLGGLTWVFLRLLGPVVLPFLLGYGVAKLAESPICVLTRHRVLPRWAASGLCVFLLYGGLLGALGGLLALLIRELGTFLGSLPELALSLADPLSRLQVRLLRLAGQFPDGIGQVLAQGIRDFFRTGAGLADKLYQGLFALVSGALRQTPDLALFLLTAVLSGFMLAAELPRLRQLWDSRVPPALQEKLDVAAARLGDTLGAWARTQLKLMSLSFCLFTLGLWLLGVDYPLLMGLIIALVDALPVLGAGTVLIPWGLLRLLTGNRLLGFGMLGLYAAASLTRTALEPRILGRQMGLDPLLTLLSLYAGYRFLGLWGMLLFPMALMLGKQLWGSAETP